MKTRLHLVIALAIVGIAPILASGAGQVAKQVAPDNAAAPGLPEPAEITAPVAARPAPLPPTVMTKTRDPMAIGTAPTLDTSGIAPSVGSDPAAAQAEKPVVPPVANTEQSAVQTASVAYPPSDANLPPPPASKLVHDKSRY